MRISLSSIFLSFLVTFVCLQTQKISATAKDTWHKLEAGLSIKEFSLPAGEGQFVVVRIDPEVFEFVLCASSLDGKDARTLTEWGEEYNLTVAINAGMYLPDGKTNLGYMRQGEYINNGRLAQRLGAFFVAYPDQRDLPTVAILDRTLPDLKEKLTHYKLVIQNYRMIDAQRNILWSIRGQYHSISAVAQDGQGQILFIHCRTPVEVHDLVACLLNLPLDIRKMMYVEGGGQASLLLRSTTLQCEFNGESPVPALLTGDLRVLLPNILGVRKKN